MSVLGILKTAGKLVGGYGEAAAGQAASSGLGLLFNNLQQKQNYKWGEKAAEADYARQMELYERQYKDKSPLNIVNQLKEAGLNKGLMFSGGAGGVGGAASGTTAGTNKLSTLGAQQLQSLAITKAQLDNIRADTQQKLSTIPKTQADTGLAQANINKVNTEVENIKADTALKGSTQILNQLQQNSITIANEFNAENNKILLQQNLQNVRKLTSEANVSEATQTSLIELTKANLNKVLSDITINNSTLQLNEIQKNVMRTHITEMLNSISISRGKLKVDQGQLQNAINTLEQNKDLKIRELHSGAILNQIRGVSNLIYDVLGTGKDFSDVPNQ